MNHQDSPDVNLLFVCSMNQWRSPTAENVYRKREGVRARSRGTSENARRTVAADDLVWADLVFVMEYKHREQLVRKFPLETKNKEIHVLDIPDSYQYMDSVLMEEIAAAVDPIIAEFKG